MTQPLAAIAGAVLFAVTVLGLVAAVVLMQDWDRFRP